MKPFLYKMLLCFLLCSILLTPGTHCIDSTASKSGTASTAPPKSIKGKLSTAFNTTTRLLSDVDGADELVLTLLQENHTAPDITNDIGKNRVVARKGAVYMENAEKSQEISVPIHENTINKLGTSGEKPNTINKHMEKKNNSGAIKNQNTMLNQIINGGNKTKILQTPKKPLTLIASKLESMTIKSPEVSYNNKVLPATVTIPYLTSPSGPGMVMPVVITILLVPMFAVLGYMALRRGQEAWKNRHYKRMDFLLDGMYND